MSCGVREVDEGGVGSNPVNGGMDAQLTSRINKGKNAVQKDFPFQTGLYKDKNSNTDPFCSASIISPLYLLTAGHCLVDNDQTRAKVYALVESQTEGKIPSKKILLHEKYYASKSEDKAGFILNDIGLVYLSEAIFFNSLYRPICIHDAAMSNSAMQDQDLIVAGYGGESKLKQATFNFNDHKLCEKKHDIQFHNNTYNNETKIEDPWKNKFCASSSEDTKKNGIATCKGDSGAPLMVKLNEWILGKLTVKYSLVGIVSAGPGDCSEEQLPTIFTEVFGYSEWINNITSRQDYANSGMYGRV